MKLLLNKSNDNINASELLKNEELYAPSIHCAYYSSINEAYLV